ncbi:hypothetical protein FRB90_002175, partial [Tulasnella sp. 427]
MTALGSDNLNPPSPPQQLLESVSQTLESLDEVRYAIAQNDWDRLRSLSMQPGGFGVEGRKEAWPYLLHATAGAGPSSDRSKSPETSEHSPKPQDNHVSIADSLDSLPEYSVEYNSEVPEAPHPDERQVGLDTDRSFVMYPA